MDYEHKCYACDHEWEESYSIHADPPKVCPNCKVEGKVKRLITGAPAVRVTLGRIEQKVKLKEETLDLSRKMKTDERLRANIMGEDKYHEQKVAEKTISDNLKNL
jgi:putative FmdB family regulatory protein